MAEVSVQVCYATPEWEFLEDLRLPEGATIEQALHASSLAARLPGFDPAGAVVAQGSLGETPWPGTSALYWAEM